MAIEKKLIKLVNTILKDDPTEHMWHRDEALKNHFRVGNPKGPCIECSWQVVGKVPTGELIVRNDERTELRWPVNHGSALQRLVYFMEHNAIRMTTDPAYQHRLKSKIETSRMRTKILDPVRAFFYYW